MSAETLTIALVVLVGATILGMVKEFFAKPWDMAEGTVYIETWVATPVPAPAPQPRPAPALRPVALPAPQPLPVPALAHATVVTSPRQLRLDTPEPALLAAD